MVLWLGVVNYAVLRQEGGRSVIAALAASWPFWLVGGLVTALIGVLIRRSGSQYGWAHYWIGTFAVPVAALIARISPIDPLLTFGLVIALVVLAPLPRRAVAPG